MMDQKQEAWTLTLGERMVLAARLAVLEHLRQSISAVPVHGGSNGSDPVRQPATAELVGAR